MTQRSSYRQILRSSSIIGGASVINILVGLLRLKVAAVLLGPAGVGLIGLLQSLMSTSSTVASLGIGMVGTRQIAEANGRDAHDAVAAARRALFWGTLVLAVLGAGVFWLLRSQWSHWVLDRAISTTTVGWLAIGVALTVAAGSQVALLNGLRRIGDIARVNVLSALVSTALGVGALLTWGEAGLVVFVLSAPVATFVLGHWYVSRLPPVAAPPTPLPQLMVQWGTLLRLGAAFMVSGLVVTLGQLVVRTLVQRELGADSLGQFQAAWMISMTYIGFVLGAMATDYYPRLTAAIHDHAAVNRMVNEQTEVALLLAGPVFLAMLGLAPWVIELLYSRQFDQAADVLRWQVLGDVLKLLSWPLGFILLALGHGRTFMLTESLAIATFTGLTWVGLPLIGVEATGIAFLGMYAVYLPVVYLLARSRTGFRWDRSVARLAVATVVAAMVVLVVSRTSDVGAAIAGLVLAAASGLYGVKQLRRDIPLLAGSAALARLRAWIGRR